MDLYVGFIGTELVYVADTRSTRPIPRRRTGSDHIDETNGIYQSMYRSHLPRDINHLISRFKASFSFILLYRPSVAAVKISVLLLYRRIFPQKRFRILLYWYGAFVLVYTTLFVLLDMFHCRPVYRAWSTMDKSSCLDMDTTWVVGGSLNAITDIAALCLPMPLLWQLHLTKEKRLQLMGVFLLGGL